MDWRYEMDGEIGGHTPYGSNFTQEILEGKVERHNYSIMVDLNNYDNGRLDKIEPWDANRLNNHETLARGSFGDLTREHFNRAYNPLANPNQYKANLRSRNKSKVGPGRSSSKSSSNGNGGKKRYNLRTKKR